MEGKEYIYVLSLTGDKWYVGRTANVEKRLKNHRGKRGSAWTKKYDLIALEYVARMLTEYDEDNKVLDMMAEYGIDNVRGGSFSQVILSSSERKTITKMIRSSSNSCFKCGEAGHYALNCSKKNKRKLAKVVSYSDDCPKKNKRKLAYDESVVKSLINWCDQNIDTTMIFYLVDNVNKNYRFYSSPYEDPRIDNLRCEFDEFATALKRKSGRYDLLFDAGPYRLFCITEKGMSRLVREGLTRSITESLA